MPSSTTLQLDAHRFSRAFVNISNAYIPTKGPIELTRTILIEVFNDVGIQLVASDGLLLMRQFVPLDSRGMQDEPTSDVQPDESLVVQDPDRLGLALAKVIYAHAKTSADSTGICEALVELQVNPLVRPDTPALPSLEPWGLTIAFENSKTQLPILDVKFKEWRAMMTDEFLLPDAIESLIVAPKLLARIGKIKGNDGGVHFSFIGNGRPVTFIAYDSAGAPVVRGILASMTRKENVENPPMEGQKTVDFGSPDDIADDDDFGVEDM